MAPPQDTLLQVHTYNVLLHLCSGGNQAEDTKKRVFAEQSAEVSTSTPGRFFAVPASGSPS
jgi:hypothetical protein